MAIGRGEAGEEGDPSRHEAPLRAEGVGEVDVLAAGAREVDAQLGVAQRSGKGEQGAHRPAGQDQIRALPRSPAMKPVEAKMPVPTMLEITSAVALKKPSCRNRPGLPACVWSWALKT